QDRFVARAAAAPDRAAAALEKEDAHAVAAEHLHEPDLGLVELPAGGDEAAVLVRVGIAEHHLLLAPERIDKSPVFGDGEQPVHHARAGPQVLDRFHHEDTVL